MPPSRYGFIAKPFAINEMRNFSLIFSLFLIQMASYGQINLNRLSKDYCDCFKQKRTQSEKKVDRALRKCLKDKNEYYNQDDLKEYFSSSTNQIEFLKKIGGSCEELIEYFMISASNTEELSDAEYTDNIYRVLEYFSTDSQVGKLPKSVYVNSDEIGILYNILLNKISSNQTYGPGAHSIAGHDSLIIYDIRSEAEFLSCEAVTKEDEIIKVDLDFIFSLNPDSVLEIHKNIGKRYSDIVILPELRSSIRAIVGEYTSKELYLMEIDQIQELILNEILGQTGLIGFFLIQGVIIRDIQFPHILNQAEDANLLREYSMLKNEDSEIRMRALKNLFDSHSEIGYIMILDHWSTEYDQKILDFIVDRFLEKK